MTANKYAPPHVSLRQIWSFWVKWYKRNDGLLHPTFQRHSRSMEHIYRSIGYTYDFLLVIHSARAFSYCFWDKMAISVENRKTLLHPGYLTP